MLKSSVLDAIGNTPLIRLSRLERETNVKAEIYAKCESFNPYSVKDRAALYMIENAEKSGALKAESVIIEPTSGNTGIGLTMVAKVKGYKIILTMPETMSQERRTLLKRLGAQLVLTDGKLGMQGAIDKAHELAAAIPETFIPSQFENEFNKKAHYETTAKEIIADIGVPDAFVAGVGTGGTISGVGEALRPQGTRIIAVEPSASAVLSGKPKGAHMLQGIGAGFIPKLLNRDIIDDIYTVDDLSAFEAVRLCAETEGLLIGISSGAALSAAIKLSEKLSGKKIVVMFPDGGEKYLSMDF